MANYAIMCDKPRKNSKRAKFQDVIESIWEQMDDLDHDLTDAVLVAPKGATSRQVLLALNHIRKQSD